jgi:hypothetical protein
MKLSSGLRISTRKKHLRNCFFPDVCWLRLDFESFTLLGPTVSTETQGGLCPDTFRVTVSDVISDASCDVIGDMNCDDKSK